MLALFPSRAVAIEIAGFSVHWYGILYLLSFVLALVILPSIQRLRKLRLTRDEWVSVLSAAIVGVIAGGRLGYVFFYEPAFFASEPWRVVAVWEGGMSSHGGFLGTAVALSLAAWRMKIPSRALADVVTVPAALGLALGRFGNFINQELFGIPTSLPWGIRIPGVMEPRHPLQLYDAALSLAVAALCFAHLKARPESRGRTFALFLILYGAMRFFLEYVREQQYPVVDTGVLILTRGQLLTLPLLLAGVLLWRWFREDATERS